MSDQGDPNPYSYQGTAYTTPAQHSDPRYGRPMKFSRLGIWSFVLSLISIFGLFALVLVAGIFVINNPEIENDDSHPVSITLGLVGLGVVLVGLAALVMAVVSLFMPNRKKLFGILAIVISIFLASLIFLSVVLVPDA